jgi:hypothetical protein
MSKGSITAPPRTTEPRWPALLALAAVGALHWALPEELTFGPNWLLPLLVLLLMAPAVIARYRGIPRVANVLGHITVALLTVDLIASLVLLITRLPQHKESPLQLLFSAGALWISNLLIFASWYWRLDAGGPFARELRHSHTDGAFLFPQMVLDPDLRREMGEDTWSPGFVDYLFLAFNTSTAFSPTDVPVLSRWAKALMMVQSSISLATVVLLAARAVNVI